MHCEATITMWVVLQLCNYKDFNGKTQRHVSSVITVVYMELLVMLQMHESVVFHKRMYAAHP